MNQLASPAIVGRAVRRHYPGLSLEETETIRHEIDAALIPIAREHSLSMRTLLKLASVGGSAVA